MATFSPLTIGLLSGAAESAKYGGMGGGLLGGSTGFIQGYNSAEDRELERRRAQTMEELRRARLQQAQNQMERQEQQREAYQGLLSGLTGARSVGEATAPGPGGMASGGRGGPSPAQARTAQNVQMRGLLEAMGPEAGTSLLAERMFAQPESYKTSRLVRGADLGMQGEDAQRMFEVQLNPDGSIAGYQSLGGGGQTIQNIVGGQSTPFQEKLADIRAKQLGEVVDAGNRAANTETLVNRMSGILSSENLNTGRLQPLVSTLQAYGQDAGINVEGIAESAGINLNDIGSTEEFERLSRDLTMNVLSGFKGQTSDRELGFAREQVAKLGTSEEGNIRALASMKALAQVARENAQRAAGINNMTEFQRFQQEALNRGPERVKELTQRFEKQLRSQVGGRATFGADTGANRQDREYSLPIGTVEGGYEYQGGDPGDPSNWKEVR